MAVAPNANIGLVAGTTPGIDPRFAQVFSRNKISGKYLDLNHNLVKDLKNMGLWEEVKEKIIEAQGDISHIDGLPQYLKEIYKTAFTTNPYAYIEVAARAQKWVDQALSRNMYLESRDMGDMKQVYMTAWKKGLKTTYYLHMKPRHTAEQSTTNVNKAEMTGKRGFGGIKVAATGVPANATPSPVQMDTPSPMRVEEMVTVAANQAPAPQIAAEAPRGGGFSAVRATASTQPAAAASVPVMTAAAPSAATLAAVSPSFAIPMPASSIPQPQPSPIQQKPMGFATVASQAITQAAAPITEAPKKKNFVCPVDPQERLLCDSCQ
jgi:ribonucleoside-diphosphate reductase alpha chain